MALPRQRGMRSLIFLDDILFIAESGQDPGIRPSWVYPILLPILLPPHKRLLYTKPYQQSPPLVVSNRFQLAAWKISGKPTLQRKFQSGLQTISCQDGARVPRKRTNPDGPSGLAGVLQGRLIPFQLMSNISSIS